MSKPDTSAALNRLLSIHYRSLPMYLTDACPWTHRGDDQAVGTLSRIVEDQKQLSNRIANELMDRHVPLETEEFPLDFPDTHDLSLDFLVSKLVRCQQNDIAAIEQCVAALQGDRPAAALAEEALGAARGHLETLEELATRVSKSSSWSRAS